MVENSNSWFNAFVVVRSTLKGSKRMSTTVGMDIDHIPWEQMREVKERVLAKKNELGLLMLEESARSYPQRGEGGYHLAFKRRPELSQEENLKWASELLGVAYDDGAKDITRVFFTTTEKELGYLDDEIFNPSPDLSNPSPDLPRGGGEDPSPDLPRGGGERDVRYRGIPYASIINEYWQRTGGVPVDGERNVRLHKLAVNLRAICDNKREVLLAVMPRLGLSEQEMASIVDSACKETPKGISKIVKQIINDLQESPLLLEGAEGEVSGETPPPMPRRLPKLIQLLLSRTPDIYKPAVAHAVFPALAAHLYKVKFRYIDNVLHEATLMNVLMAGTGAGKDCISQPINYIMADIRKRDAENLERERQWKQEVRD